MKEIEQIKMRTDLKILTKDYGFNYHSLGEIFNCHEKVVRDFVNIKTRTLNDIHYQSIKKGLLNIQQELKEAEEYKEQVIKQVKAEMQIKDFATITKNVRLEVILIVPARRQTP